MNAGATPEKPGLWARAGQLLQEDREKWGGMTFGAMVRLGLAELREAFSLGGDVEQPTPYGMYGTLTPGEVSAARQVDPQAPQMEEGATMKGNQPTPTPSQIIDNPKAYLPQQEGPQQGNVMGQDRGQGPAHGHGGPTPSPSQVIDNPQAYLPQQEKQAQNGMEQQQQHEQGREM